jgi:hypothetical protein
MAVRVWGEDMNLQVVPDGRDLESQVRGEPTLRFNALGGEDGGALLGIDQTRARFRSAHRQQAIWPYVSSRALVISLNFVLRDETTPSSSGQQSGPFDNQLRSFFHSFLMYAFNSEFLLMFLNN